MDFFCHVDSTFLHCGENTNFPSGQTCKMLPLIVCFVLVYALAAAIPTLLSATMWVWSVFIFLMGKIGLHGRIKEVEGIYNPKCNIVFTAVLSQISFPLINTRFG